MRYADAITDFLATLGKTPATALDPDLDLLEHGMLDSIGVMQLVSWITERYGVDHYGYVLDAEDMRSVRAIDAFITHQVDTGPHRAVRTAPSGSGQ
ncbi:acyl carrier protein [Streptomyces sp. NPDC050085]|uniref:acyl carrier protein n=1 Tax=Streptomyces sp. NPDC050085 TaxID=3365600 RepID=UPI0037B4AE4A